MVVIRITQCIVLSIEYIDRSYQTIQMNYKALAKAIAYTLALPIVGFSLIALVFVFWKITIMVVGVSLMLFALLNIGTQMYHHFDENE